MFGELVSIFTIVGDFAITPREGAGTGHALVRTWLCARPHLRAWTFHLQAEFAWLLIIVEVGQARQRATEWVAMS